MRAVYLTTKDSRIKYLCFDCCCEEYDEVSSLDDGLWIKCDSCSRTWTLGYYTEGEFHYLDELTGSEADVKAYLESDGVKSFEVQMGVTVEVKNGDH